VVKTHSDELGLILPLDIAPVQIAFIIFQDKDEIVNSKINDYYREIFDFLSSSYRCQLYNKRKRNSDNIFQADKDGCVFKIFIGLKELENKEIVFTRRDQAREKQMTKKVDLLEKLIVNSALFTEEIKKRSENFSDNYITSVDDKEKLFTMIKEEVKGLFLIPFCNQSNCELESKKKVGSFSMRCISDKEISGGEVCIFCEEDAKNFVFLGRSY
jgi:prolyl-tRNA synthetase